MERLYLFAKEEKKTGKSFWTKAGKAGLIATGVGLAGYGAYKLEQKENK